MICKRLQYFGSLLVVLLATVMGFAQVPTGVPPFSSVGGGPFDVVDLANLNVHFTIPIVSKAGRGLSFTYNINYDSSVWYPVGTSGSQVWTPVTNFAWPAQTQIAQGNTGSIKFTTFTTPCFDGTTHYIITHYQYTRFTDASGVAHPFNVTVADTDVCGTGRMSDSQLSSDGSGYTLFANVATAYVTSRSGWGIYPPLTSGAQGTISDTNGNYISFNSTTGVFTDTLGKTVLTVTGVGTTGNPLNLAFANPGGTTSTAVVTYANFKVKTSFGCTGVSEFSNDSIPLATTIAMPGVSTPYSITYEPTPGNPTYVTGRIASIILPTGGEIDYAYTGTNHGIVCADGSAIGLTRTLNAGGGTWTYARALIAGSQWTTTITDPQGNDTKINFQGLYETSRQSFQGAAGGTPLQTVVTCYNGTLTACDSTAVTLPIGERTVTLQLAGGKQSKRDVVYDSLGRVTTIDDYDFGDGAPPTTASRRTSVGYALLGNNIVDRPASITVYDASGGSYIMKAQTSYGYDAGTPTSTTGTPQHNGVTGSRGNVTSVISNITSGTSLTRSLTYYDAGTVKTSTDVNGAVTTNVYGSGSCGNSFVTEVDLPISILKRYVTWDSACNGAVVKTAKDESGNTTTYDYTDPNYWRITKITDPLTNYTTVSYPDVNSAESSLSFGSTNVDVRATVDGFGRPKLVQRLNAGTTYDSVETDYDSMGRASKSVLPFSASPGIPCSGTCPGTTSSYDPLSRMAQATDAGTGDVSYDYTPGATSNNNDLLVAVEPAPPGTSENSKKRQLEADGLGRLSSVCEITSGSGSGSCVQSNGQTGFFTKYSYDVLDRLVGVSQNAQSAHPQGRTFTYDFLGRLTSEANPETGTTNYTYDSATGCTGTYNGDLVKKVDAKGNTSCYTYDSLHRVTSITYSGPYTTPAKTYVYDSATVNSVVMSNVKGRLAEAYTGPSSPKTTDLGFSYNARGDLVDVYQSTPHSGGYYHVTASYFPNGALNTIQNLPSLPTITYGLDSEGRPKTVSASTGVNPVSNTIYNTASQVTEVDFGSLDKDTFQYDSNTGRMTQYKFIVGTPNVTGNLTWNANGTLKTLAINDGLNSADTQTCTYGYDDLARVASSSCGSAWNQTFGYDPFGNISKSGTSSFAAGYLLADSSTNNRIQSLPGVTVTYDSNGNLTSDGTHSYAWDAEGRPTTIDTTTLTYDALGRMVEKAVSAAYTQMVYSPMGGKLALMNGQTLSKAFVPLPGGATVVYTASGIAYYRHSDWLGGSRVASTPSRTKYYDVAYAPFGESYAGSGTTDLSFTGQNQDAVGGHDDFLFRELNPVHGRWISPDPAGAAAVNPNDPQSWNRYAYVANHPLDSVDPLGLCRVDGVEYSDDGWPCRGAGGGGGGGGGGSIPIWGSTSEWVYVLGPNGDGAQWEYQTTWFVVDYVNIPGQAGSPGVGGGGGRSCLAGAGPLAPGQSPCAANNGSWLQQGLNYLKTHPVFISVNEILAAQITYQASTGTICANVGAGASVPPTKAVTVGVLNGGDMGNWTNVQSSWGYSFGANLFLGYQGSFNSSGKIGGPTVSGVGLSGSYTYGGCTTIP